MLVFLCLNFLLVKLSIRNSIYRCSKIGSSDDGSEKDKKVKELLGGDSTGSEHGGVLLHAQVFSMDTHHKLNEAGEGQ